MPAVYRSAEWDTPWWDRPNRGPGRFNRRLSEPTQYLSEHPLTVFAERLRALGRPAVEDIDTIRWRCWVMDVPLEGLTIVDFDSAATFGIAPEELVDDDWSACQDLAERRRQAGDVGILVPSAALPGTRNVVLFGRRLTSPYLLPPVDPEIESPTGHTAEDSIPPEEVLPFVRWHGDEHAELKAWQEGRTYVFLDPTPARP